MSPRTTEIAASQIVTNEEIAAAERLEARCQEIAAATGYDPADVAKVLVRLLEAGLIG